MVKGPITIRGVEYKSRSDAHRALGVTRQAIANAERRGTLDRVGLRPRGDVPQHKVSCRWDGVDYSSISDAARAHSVPYRSFFYWIEKGLSRTCELPRKTQTLWRQLQARIERGDEVLHRPSGEYWVVLRAGVDSAGAFVEPAGWSKVRARAADCDLVAKGAGLAFLAKYAPEAG